MCCCVFLKFFRTQPFHCKTIWEIFFNKIKHVSKFFFIRVFVKFFFFSLYEII